MSESQVSHSKYFHKVAFIITLGYLCPLLPLSSHAFVETKKRNCRKICPSTIDKLQTVQQEAYILPPNYSYLCRDLENIEANEIHNKNQQGSKSVLNRRSAVGTVISRLTAAIATSTTGWSGMSKAEIYETNQQRNVPDWTLKGNVRMPILALNTVGLSTADTERAVGYAVGQGITHIDFHPGKERDGVAAYLSNNPSIRSTLFLNTKIRKVPPGTSPKEAAAQTRKQINDDLLALNLSNVDMLMLRDSPDCAVIQAQWAVLEEALKKGVTRSLGVINFCESALSCLLETATIRPALNYYMLHAGMGRDAHGLRDFCDSRGIRTFAYGAIGEPDPNSDLLSNPLLIRIGRQHNNKSPEQVALRWVLQTGAAVSVRPTQEFGLGRSVCSAESRRCFDEVVKRASSFDWSLTDKDMAQLDALSSPDDNPTLFSSAGCPGAFVMP